MADLSKVLVDSNPNPSPPSDPTPELPDKFKGKDVSEIVKSYTELESKLGRQANELGALRAQLSQPREDTSDDDFLDDPRSAVAKEVRQAVTPLIEKQFKSELDTARPGWENIVQDSNFQEWVMASRARQLLLREAQGYDVESAQELIDNWAAKEGITEEMASASAEQAIQQDRRLRAATTEAGTVRRPEGKVYSRAWIRHLKATNPGEYKAQFDKIYAAYAEGRVTD